ncbi:sensor histidine kinase [Paenibacillus contaminans]|uniref:histidine kinase n=1 Tax=Paenibacillus contaminans TaxID=450362 RepID=A0A329M6N7_9BACL|nr:HAMP domain-containing sensor histidine kinase [Paenibacillus contaminans]RAV14846.1 two-component sensor histidine kinase [Paenibacillus contaminans]
MSNFRPKGITRKIFLITSGLLVVCTVIIFTVFYYLLPSFYRQYKVNTLNTALEQLIRESAPRTLQQSQHALNAFTRDYNVWMGIKDAGERLVFVPSPYNEGEVEGELDLSESKQEQSMPLKKINIKPIDNMYQAEKTISFLDGRYTLVLMATLQPINEASEAILLFAPYVIVLVLLISVTGAILYSKMITKPLLRINRVAKKMANLEFDADCSVHSQDEIGELSRSLNRLSHNLERTMAELKQANEQLTGEIQKERELEEKRKQFIATVSHELKTPITAVMGQIEGMIHQIGAYKDRDKYLRRSYAVMQDMEKLVKELLDISKLENSGFEPQWKQVDLSCLVKECLQQLEYASTVKHIAMSSDIAEPITIRADRSLLRKAVMNVILNAIQYSKLGEGVGVRLFGRDGAHLLEVLNTGAHIEENQLEELFQPFHRLEKSRSRSTGGSGLGLYIVREIMDIHNFDYSIRNTEQGVLFTIVFPGEAPPNYPN